MILGTRYRKERAHQYVEARDIVLTEEEAAWLDKLLKSLKVVEVDFELRSSTITDLDRHSDFRDHILMELGNKLLRTLMDLGGSTKGLVARLFEKLPLVLTARQTQFGEALGARVMVLEQVPTLPPALARRAQPPSLADDPGVGYSACTSASGITTMQPWTDTPAVEFPDELLRERFYR